MNEGLNERIINNGLGLSHQLKLKKTSKARGYYRLQQRSNQSVLREINPEYSLEGLMLRLELQ